MKKIILVVLILFITKSCVTTNNIKNNTVNFDVISKGILGGAGDEGIKKQNLVIKDLEKWQALIGKMDSSNNVSSSFSEINIDFSIYTIIAVFDDVKNSGGFGLDLEVNSDSKNTIVKVIKTAPSFNDFVTTVITQPYCIIKINKTHLPIIFQ